MIEIVIYNLLVGQGVFSYKTIFPQLFAFSGDAAIITLCVIGILVLLVLLLIIRQRRLSGALRHANALLQQQAPDVSSNREDATSQRLQRLLQRQSSLSEALLNFFPKRNTTETIHAFLKEIQDTFQADHTYIFEYNKQHTAKSCIYEISREEDAPTYANLKNIPVENRDGWDGQVLAGTAVLCDISEIPAEEEKKRQKMMEQHICSVILLPLTFTGGVWGYIGIEFTRHTYNRDQDDQLWLTSIGNIISIFIKLKESIEESASKQRYVEWLLSCIPAGIELYNAEGVLIEVNDKDLEIFGVQRREDLLGINIFEHPLASHGLRERIRAGEYINLAFNYSFDKMDHYYQTQQKGTRALITKIMPLRNPEGKIINYLILVIDNTETQNAQSRIIEFEEFFSLVGVYAKVGYARYNLVNEEGYATESWYQNLGETADTPLKEIFQESKHIHPEDRMLVKQFLKEATDGSQSKFKSNLRIDHGNEKLTWTCEHVLVRDFRPDEGIIELICINYDITEMKEMEAKLTEAKNHAETLDRLKGAFLANMSHEIRTPLNAIVGFSDLLAITEDAEEKAEYSKIIATNNELLLRLINDILSLSKIESGLMDQKPEKFDLSAYFKELCASVQQRITRPEVKLFCDNPYPYCEVFLDKNRLAQIVMNYATNAIKYTPKGFIRMGYEYRDGGIRVYVSDSGIGISEEKKNRVYQRFEKLDEFAQGTGLGLSICKAIAETSGGQVGFESTEGVGSTFWSWLPCEINLEQKEKSETTISRQTVHTAPLPPTLNRKKILIAEDVENNYKLICAMLHNNYELTWVTDGGLAVEKVRDGRYHLILMDMKMPVMNGLEAVRLIRESGVTTPIIALTAHAFDSDKSAALAAGCNDYLVKPVDKELLLATLKKWM